ncbi:MAG: DUF2934 domain-containing protein [Myxococcaceae bacterium]|nr:DUF2934 domain-containing protein [Myxococcaceae bacterium]
MTRPKTTKTTKTPKQPARRPTAKKAKPARAVAAGAQVLATTPVAATAEAATPRLVTRAELTELVRREAYRLATHRNFQNGSPFQDWVNAEAAVRAQLDAQGARAE